MKHKGTRFRKVLVQVEEGVRGHHYGGKDSIFHSAPRKAPAKLALKANDVLRRNDMGGWTKAAPEHYPHQWSWDSAFITIGLAHLNTQRWPNRSTICFRRSSEQTRAVNVGLQDWSTSVGFYTI